MATDTNDNDGYKSPPASVDNLDDRPWGPFSKRKILLDDYHTCPCCNGTGFVGIVPESIVPLNKTP